MFAIVLSIHIIICFFNNNDFASKIWGGGLGIGQAGGGGGLGDYLSARSTSNVLTRPLFWLCAFSLLVFL